MRTIADPQKHTENITSTTIFLLFLNVSIVSLTKWS